MSSADKLEVLNVIIHLVKEQDEKIKQLTERFETLDLALEDRLTQHK